MDIRIKEFADCGDLKSLKYIFVDALDVDPTFVRYEEEYNYCKSVPGLLEEHKELTPFVYDTTRWDEIYWTKLKMDLIKNFSDCRMSHMREVAKVFLAEKCERIMTEREKETDTNNLNMENDANATIGTSDTVQLQQEKIRSSVQSRKEEQEKMLLRAQAQLEQENREIAAKRQLEAERLERQRKLYQENTQKQTSETYTKKAIGIVIAAIAVIVILVIILLK